MTRFRYREGFLFCTTCGKQYKKEDCPYFQSKVQHFQVCPFCPTKYKLRAKPHNKNSTRYYREVIKPQLDKDREVIIKWKQKRYDNDNDNDNNTNNNNNK